MIQKLQDMQIGQQIRDDGPQSHLVKKGTPTMGGTLIIFAVVISTLLWTNLSANYVWLILLVTVGYGLIGFIDDYRKLAGKSSKGVPGKTRLAAEIMIALFVSMILYSKPGFNSHLSSLVLPMP
jgi:phospho-N-acetylmuramoyl-pentapeptide-transferase